MALDPITQNILQTQNVQAKQQEKSAATEPFGTTTTGLVVPAGQTLTIPSGITLRHWGTITGSVTVNGTKVLV